MSELILEQETFTYSELTPVAQSAAFEQWNSNVEVFDDWHECVYEDWKGKLGERGVTDVEISFSGFYSQGDGACFIGSIDLRELLEWEHQNNPEHSMALKYSPIYISQININPGEWANFNIKLVRGGGSNHYSHENTVSIESELECSSEELEGELSQHWYDGEYSGSHSCLETEILELCRNWMKEIYKDLEADYNYYFSQECFDEECSNEDWTFTEDGELIED